MTRLLLAGTGLIGHRHLEHILEHPDFDLAGIIDPVAERRAMADAPGFPDIGGVDVDADGIVIATPTDTHAPLAIEAARRGWHILVEKPLAGTLEDADRMIAAARDAGVHILVGHHRRHHPVVSRLQKIVAEGALGQPVLASLIWAMCKPDGYFVPEWRAGMNGAPVKQNLIHDIDTLRYLFGEIREVVGIGSNAVRGAQRTESGGAVLAFEGGMTVTIAFADTTPTPWGFEAGTGESPGIPKTGQDSLRIAFTRGGVEFPSLKVWSGAEDWSEVPQMRQINVEHGVPLVRQLEHFADVIAGHSAPIIDGTDGRRTLEATLRVEAATLHWGAGA
ncbi:MAG: Gfo/Idh/MocA family oxidoreductase [Pseudomonadota bacterium]